MGCIGHIPFNCLSSAIKSSELLSPYLWFSPFGHSDELQDHTFNLISIDQRHAPHLKDNLGFPWGISKWDIVTFYRIDTPCVLDLCGAQFTRHCRSQWYFAPIILQLYANFTNEDYLCLLGVSRIYKYFSRFDFTSRQVQHNLLQPHSVFKPLKAFGCK